MHARPDQLKLRSVLGALFVALLVNGCAAAPVAAPASPHAGTAAGPPFVVRWQDAKARAAREHKPIFVDAWAPWCHTCLSMRSFVLSDPALRPFYDRFVWLALDVERPESAEFLARYPVGGLPTFLVVDGVTGDVKRRWLGAMTLAELRQLLQDGEEAMVALSNRDLALTRLYEAHGLLLAGKTEPALERYRSLLGSVAETWPRRLEVLVALVDALSRQQTASAAAECTALVGRELEYLGKQASPMAGDFVAYVDDCLEASSPDEGPHASLVRKKLVGHLVKLVDNRQAPLSDDDRGDALGLLYGLLHKLDGKADLRPLAERRLRFLDEAAAKVDDPGMQSTYDWARAETALWLGQGERAITLLERRERELPADYNPAHRLARVYVQLGRLPEALVACERALAKAYGPRRIDVLGLRADILERLGRRADALVAAELTERELRALPPPQQKPRLVRASAARLKRLQTPAAEGK